MMRKVCLVSSATDIDLRKNEYQSINPVNGAITASYETMSDAEVHDLVSRAAKGYESWAAKTPQERGKILERVGQLFVERSDELAKIAAEEMGKPVSQGKGEAEFSGEI